MFSENVEITKGDNVDQFIRNDYSKYIKRIERSNPRLLKKKVNLDIISKIVERRILGSKKASKSTRESKSGSDVLNRIFQLAGIVLFGAYIYLSFINAERNQKLKETIRQVEQERLKLYEKMQSPGQKSEDAFVFEDASNFYDINYLGKDEIVLNAVSHIVNIVKILKSNNKSNLKMLKTPQKNFLLSGPPGTGKTLFVQKIVGVLDMKLKALQMKKEIPKKMLCQMTFKDKIDYMRNMPSRVRVIFLTPSFINDKYVGESEKRVRELFRLANSNPKYDATILFFDEMDAFFVDRDAKGNESFIKTQTEFLSAIGGAKDKIESSVFCIGASNRPNALDSAFNRRFSNKIVFKKPSKSEVYKLVSFYTSSWEDYSAKQVERITDLMVKIGMYQSGIVEEITSVYLYLNGTNTNKWDFLYKKLNNNKSKASETTLKSYPNEMSSSFCLEDTF